MGGSERYVCTLSKHQSRTHDVHIYTTTKYRDRVGASVSNGVTIHKSYAPVTIWNINPLTFMLPALTKSKSDIFHIHSHLYLTSNQAILAKIMNKRKALLHLHGGVGSPPYKVSRSKLFAKRFYDKTLGKFTIKNSDILASVSKADLEEISSCYKIDENRLRYIPNMVDTDMFKPNPTGAPENESLLYLGDLEPWKGIGSLINWLRLMNQTSSEKVAMRFVGQGSYMRSLLNLKERLQKSDNGISIEILGPRNHGDIPHIMRNSSALVLPSYWEGMPTVILEAMASGIPVISTRVGDVPQLIRNRETGLLIDHTLESFQNAIDSLYNNRSLISHITKNALNVIENEYTIDNIHRIVRNVYTDMAS